MSFVVSLFVCVAIPQESPNVDSLVKQFAAAATDGSLRDRQQSATALFSVVNAADAQQMKLNSNDSVALAAAWHEVYLSFPTERSSDLFGWYRGEPIDRSAIYRFIGFVEGRLRVAVPASWAQALENTTVDPVRMTTHLHTLAHWPLHATTAGFSADPGIDASFDGDDMVIRTETGTCRLSEQTRPPYIYNGLTIAAIMDQSHAVIGFGDIVGYGYPLHCVQRSDNSVIWSQQVHAAHWGGASGTGENSRVAVFLTDGRVFVFGSCHLGSYLEVFCRKSGQPLVRFSTVLHNNVPANKAVNRSTHSRGN